MNTPALLPCPFCGGEPGTHEGHADITYITCDQCGAIASFRPRLMGDKAAEVWNRRATLDDPGETKAQFCPCGKYAANPVIVQMLSTPRAAEAVTLAEIRTAVADYMRSEGCSCCRDSEAHEVNAARLARLLNVEPYDDGDGYNFSPYRSAALTPPSAKGENSRD